MATQQARPVARPHNVEFVSYEFSGRCDKCGARFAHPSWANIEFIGSTGRVLSGAAHKAAYQRLLEECVREATDHRCGLR